MPKKILVIGPSGSGKSYISAYLRALKVNAPDADQVEGLADWFDGQGHKVHCPPDADKDFLDNHEFLWDREFLKNFLAKQDQDVYLFGINSTNTVLHGQFYFSSSRISNFFLSRFKVEYPREGGYLWLTGKEYFPKY